MLYLNSLLYFDENIKLEELIHNFTNGETQLEYFI